MHVESSQLVPGCVLLSDVKGKTMHPIIPKNTILTATHITYIQKFLIPFVDVSNKFSDGKQFIPENDQTKKNQEKASPNKNTDNMSFIDHYMYVVTAYKKEFNSWQNNRSIELSSLKKLVVPLFDRITEIGFDVFTLYHYVSDKDYMYHQHVLVGILSAYLAKKMGYDRKVWLQIGMAGLLSDCGMAKIDPSITNKEKKASPTELKEIMKHPMYSYQLIEKKPILTQAVKQAVLQHHEHLDGSGYPIGLSKNKIHKYAQIIAVSDVYYGRKGNIVFKNERFPFTIIDEIEKGRFTKYDHPIVHTFLIGLMNALVGRNVQLSNQKTGEIIFIEEKHPTQPIIRISDSLEIISLHNKPRLFIDRLLNNEH